MNYLASLRNLLRSKSVNSGTTTAHTILTPQRLLTLARTPALENSWYFIAAAAFAICNHPEEIPKIFHMALVQSPNNLATAEAAIDQSNRVTNLSTDGTPPQTLESIIMSCENIVNKLKQRQIANELREALLKGAALGGLPRCINAMTLLRHTTPLDLRESTHIRQKEGLTHEQERARGREFWDVVYGKVSRRVQGQMETAYPDMLDYALDHVYGPLLSFTGVLGAKESSLVVIACLVPQDVNPQLKGHLRGAQNNGATLEEIRAARQVALDISEWCGMKISEPVAKL
ncbi:Pxp2 protein [Saccharomycopsis crataegensis]|uniref:Pxp2 protein n=1 Tax=Saccharomycopsis crataegensis TaxID=43959 RepID=A0AAV5QNJ6_9ASCO|nr:Pxp2 protein [Saccharomycopsis crataegensis]